MAFNNLYEIVMSGMLAQKDRVTISSSNIINQQAVGYIARSPIFSSFYTINHSEKRKNIGQGIKVQGVIETGKSIPIYDPAHPAANNEGYIYKPDIDLAKEFADIMSAKSSYLVNTKIFTSIKTMQENTLKSLGEL